MHSQPGDGAILLHPAGSRLTHFCQWKVRKKTGNTCLPVRHLLTYVRCVKRGVLFVSFIHGTFKTFSASFFHPVVRTAPNRLLHRRSKAKKIRPSKRKLLSNFWTTSLKWKSHPVYILINKCPWPLSLFKLAQIFHFAAENKKIEQNFRQLHVCQREWLSQWV